MVGNRLDQRATSTRKACSAIRRVHRGANWWSSTREHRNDTHSLWADRDGASSTAVSTHPAVISDDDMRGTPVGGFYELFTGCGRTARPRLHRYKPIAPGWDLGAESTIDAGRDLDLCCTVEALDLYCGDVWLVSTFITDAFHRAVTADAHLAFDGGRAWCGLSAGEDPRCGRSGASHRETDEHCGQQCPPDRPPLAVRCAPRHRSRRRRHGANASGGSRRQVGSGPVRSRRHSSAVIEAKTSAATSAAAVRSHSVSPLP